MEVSTPDDERTVDALARAIDEAGSVDELEERRALASIERRMFQAAPNPIRLSRYLLLRPLGSGGAGVVYDGYDPELARRVAIKVLRPVRRDSESAARARARFVREAQSIARLSHPNVIGVFDVGTYSTADLDPEALQQLARSRRVGHDDGVFIVMEVVNGGDVASWLEAADRTWRQILAVFIAAGRGLAAAHASGIVHRDFKPGNVLVGKDGRVKVVDFGLALTYGTTESSSGSHSGAPGELSARAGELRIGGPHEPRAAEGLDKLTRTGALVGTPAYMAPEQHTGEAADQKADQFAFCASLFRALYGRYPFDARTVEALLGQKLGHQVAAPERSKVPAWLRRILLRGLSPRPIDRFADMDALLAALANDPARRARRVASAAAIPLGVAAIAYTGWLLTRPGTVDVLAQRAGVPVAGVEVWIDDEPLPRQGDHARGEVAAGLHRVRVTAPNHRPAETVVDVRRGGVHDLAVELQHDEGIFDLEVDPRGGSVFVDGVDFGSRLKNFRIDTGVHDIRVRHEGYEDETLRWTASAEETTRGFVSLRRALVWSRPSSGSMPLSAWVGDATGDGRADLVHRRFNIVSLFDPWNGVDHWKVELRRQSVAELCDADGDGVDDLVALEWEDGRTRVAVRSGRASGALHPRLAWEDERVLGDSDDDALALGGVVCTHAIGGRPVVVVGGPWRESLVAYDGSNGHVLWRRALEGQVYDLVALRGHGGPRLVALTADAIAAFHDSGAPVWSRPQAVAPRSADARKRWTDELVRLRSQNHTWTRAAALDTVAGDDLLAYTGFGDTLTMVALAGGDGAPLWARAAAGLAAFEDVGALDVDTDGTLDLLVGTKTGFELVDGRNGRARWARERAGPPASLALLGLRTRAVVSVADPARLELLDGLAGTSVAAQDLPVALSSRPVAADWNGDGHLDIVAGVASGEVAAWDERLQPLGAVPMPVVVTRIDPRRDGNDDGFADLLVEANGPAVLVGPKVRWRRRYHDAVRAAPVAGDIDGDGALEILAFAPDAAGEAIHRLDAATGTLEVRASAGGGKVIRAASLLRTAEGFDAFAIAPPYVHRYRGRDLKPVASFDLETGWAQPTIADTDLDGRPEVYAPAWEPASMMYALDAADLALRWKAELPHGSFAAPWVGDVDRDGAAEVVLTLLDGEVVALSAADGAGKWRTNVGGRLNYGPVVGDLDGDGALELVVAPKTETDDLVVLAASDGRELHRFAHVGSRRSAPVLFDIDADGHPEILSGTRTAGIVALRGTGQPVWRHRFGVAGAEQPGVSGPLALADLESDGAPELLAGFEDGSLRVIDPRDGTGVWTFHTDGGDIEGAPLAVDVDGDGRLEVFIGGHDRQLYCLRHRPPRRDVR
jgi:serine/threonine protein kinase/outer membrane protein assembly factor BamB